MIPIVFLTLGILMLEGVQLWQDESANGVLDGLQQLWVGDRRRFGGAGAVRPCI
jgi:hypothetical protein